jgi:hypothetical protein
LGKTLPFLCLNHASVLVPISPEFSFISICRPSFSEVLSHSAFSLFHSPETLCVFLCFFSSTYRRYNLGYE